MLPQKLLNGENHNMVQIKSMEIKFLIIKIHALCFCEILAPSPVLVCVCGKLVIFQQATALKKTKKKSTKVQMTSCQLPSPPIDRDRYLALGDDTTNDTVGEG